jgi:hypothetical protein
MTTATVTSAQVFDDFSDGDFTGNPAWSGDGDKFVVVPYVFNEGNLMLRSNNSGAANYYLSTPNSLVENTQWEFFINLRFATSGSNYVDAWLVSDNANLGSAQNGYFVRIGRTQDDITLQRRTNGTDAVLIDGPDGQVGSSSNNPFNIRVARDNAGLWSLFADQGATGNYQLIGVATDGTHTSTIAFGFRIVQSTAASVVNNHWFDHVSVGPIPVDDEPPTLLAANALTSTTVELLFDEAVTETSAAPVSNYLMDGGIGNPITAQRDPGNLLRVVLTFGESLQANTAYNLTVQGVQDLAGNTMAAQTVPVLFFVPVQVGFREIVFNELMADPTPVVGLPNAEFIELLNTTADKFINLNGWVLVNTTTPRTLSQAILPPGGKILLCNTTNVPLFEPFGPVMGIASFVALTNSADSLTLLNPEGDLIDVVSYTDAWYNDNVKKEGGWTLEQINPFVQCSGGGNWSASNDPGGGTPNAPNSIFDPTPDTTPPTVTGYTTPAPDAVHITFSKPLAESSFAAATYTISPSLDVTSATPTGSLSAVLLQLSGPLELGVPYTITLNGLTDCEGIPMAPNTTVEILFGEIAAFGDLVINEIMADPTPAVGLPPHEYFELLNVSNKIIDLQGCNLSGRPFSFPRLVMPGEHVLCVSSSVVNDFSAYPNVYIMQGMSTTFFTNAGREVTLTNQNGELVNTVTYDPSYYQDPTKQDGGWSLELINPFAPCSGAQNWRASVHPSGGTPGFENSVLDTSPDVTPPLVIGFSVPNPDQVTVLFSEIMDEASLLGGDYTWSGDLETLSANAEEGFTAVTLLLSGELQTGETYILTINGPLDCSGNPLATNTTLTVQLGEAPGEFELLISEIMADPTPVVGLPDAEYFELYNASDKVIQLQNCRISGRVFTFPRLIHPGEYVLCTSSSNAQAFSGFESVYFLEGLSTTFLTNGGFEMLLTAPDGTQIDRVRYNLSWYRNRSKENGGWSLERINLFEPCRGADNWTASVHPSGGTPGAQNSVYSTEPDLTPPLITAVLVQSANQLEIRFNEVIDQSLAIFAEIGLPGIGVQGVESIGPEHTSISVTLASNLSAGLIYDLYVSNVFDCSGNLIAPAGPLPIALPEQGEPGDVIVNEVLFNPFNGGVDFVEIVNVSSKAIGLQNWSLENQGGTNRIITPDPFTLLPGGYLVLTSDPAIVVEQYPLSRPENFLRMDAGTPAFNNSSGSVILINNAQQTIDRLDYLESYHLSLLRSVKGVSLERISSTLPTNFSGNWTSAAQVVGFATPGYLNSQHVEEETSTGTFSLQNEVFSPDNDGFQDVLLINYKIGFPGAIATVQAYDRRGRLIRTIANNVVLATEGTLTWDGTTDDNSKARIGPHLIYVDLFDTTGRTETFKLACIVAGRLNN